MSLGKFLIRLLFAQAIFAGDIRTTIGAEISQIVSGPALGNVILEGRIEAGDYDKLLKLTKLLNAGCGGPYEGCVRGLYLASPGGSLIEAMKIGRLVRTLRWDTTVPSPITNPYVPPEKYFKDIQLKDPQHNHMCASACFFIFVAGAERNSDDLDVAQNVILGIHRPYLTDSDLRATNADQAIASGNQVRDVVEGYLKGMGVPSKYADLMFSIPKEEIRWIKSADFNADFKGVIPELKDWIDARCNKMTDAEKGFSNAVENKSRSQLTEAEKPIWDSLTKKWKDQVECAVDLQFKIRKDAWAKMFQPDQTWTSWWRGIWRGK